MPANYVRRMNRPLFALPEMHPARRFLVAFIECGRDCVGKEIPYRGREHLAVDQKWFSKTDLRVCSFSGFAYNYLSFTVELDGWLIGAPTATAEEIATMERLRYLRCLMSECKEACINDRNRAVLSMVEQVEQLLDLWETCIRERWREIGYDVRQDTSSRRQT